MPVDQNRCAAATKRAAGQDAEGTRPHVGAEALAAGRADTAAVVPIGLRRGARAHCGEQALGPGGKDAVTPIAASTANKAAAAPAGGTPADPWFDRSLGSYWEWHSDHPRPLWRPRIPSSHANARRQ